MTASFLLSWLVVSAAMSALIVVAAAAVQRLTARALPARLVWGVAMLAMVGVTATQPLRRAPAITRIEGPQGTLTPMQGMELITPSPLEQLLSTLQLAPSRAIDRLAVSASAMGRTLPPFATRSVLLFWPASTALIGLVLLASYRRQRALLGRATQRPMAGTMVHVSAHTGPAVIGATAPAIVVPQWLLERSAEEQRLVVAHESAHIAAGDPQLLLAGCALVAIMPWNPAAWFALARLRLAIELDCDARVLSRGTNTREYGQLLIELSAAAPSPAIPLGAPAFSYRASHLERRLRTMTARPARFLVARRASALLVSGAALLAACGAELPTATELEGMDVAKAESRIGKVVQIDSANTRYIVNGKLVASTQARGISADSIATIEVQRGTGKLNEIRIVTKGAPIAGGAKEVSAANLTRNGGPVMVVRGQPIQEVRTGGTTLRGDSIVMSNAKPLFVINGKRSTQAEMDKLSPSAIESVEVVKGPTAVAKFGADASGGAIVINLKK